MVTNDQPRVVRSRTLSGAAALLIASVVTVTASAKDVAVKVTELDEQHGSALVRGLDFSPDGARLAVDSEGPAINIWDWKGRHIERTFGKPDGGNDFSVADPLLYSADGQLLVNCEEFGAGNVVARIWNSTSEQLVKDVIGGPNPTEPGGCVAAAFLPSDATLLLTSSTSGSQGSNLFAYGTTVFNPLWTVAIDPYFSPRSISVSPQGELIALAGDLSVPKDGKLIDEFHIYVVSVNQQKVVRRLSAETSGPMAWSADGKRIAVAGGAGDVELLDSASGAKLLSTKYEHAAHLNVRFTADGRYFIESDYNARGSGLGVKIWDSSHKTLLQEIHGNVSAIAISRDSRYLAVGEGGRTTIWQFK